jgi:hypothetical protein
MKLSQFENIEKTKNLGASIIGGVLWWDICRYEIYLKLSKSELIQSNANKFLRLKGLLVSLVSLFKISQNQDILIYSHSRAIEFDGDFVDIYTKHLIDDLASYKFVEVIPNISASLRKKNNQSITLDLIFFIASIVAVGLYTMRKIFCRKLSFELEKKIPQALIKREQGIEKFVFTKIIKFKVQKFFLKKILNIIKPKICFLVVSAGNEALISVCQDLNILTYELQHGSPSRGKLNYDYSSGIGKTYFPDFFLSFGEYFRKSCVLPLKSNQIIPFGYPFLQSKKKDPKATKENRVIIVGQDTIDQLIAPMIKSLIYLNPDFEYVYLLHPNTAKNYLDYYTAEQKRFDFKFINSRVADIHTYFRESRYTVGAYSTALYEAAFLGSQVYIIDTPHIGKIANALELGLFKLLPINMKLENNEVDNNGIALFDDYTQKKLNKIIESHLVSS